MKKFTLSMVAVLIAMVAVSQTDKGDWMVGGNLLISTPANNSEFAFTPSAGYFVARNLAVGADVTLDFTKSGSQKTSAESFGPFARYYFNLPTPVFKPFLHADINWGNQVTKVNDTKITNTTGSFFLGGGGAFFINSNVALEALAGYSHSKLQGSDSDNGFLFRFGFQVHLLGSEVERRHRK